MITLTGGYAIMSHSTRAKLIKIGNSRGVRIPSAVVEQLHLTDDIELIVKEDHLEVRSGRKPREGWDDAFRAMAAHGDDKLLDQPVATDWESKEWDW